MVKVALGVQVEVVGVYSNPCDWGDQPWSLLQHPAQSGSRAELEVQRRCQGSAMLQGSAAVKVALP